MTPHQHGAGVTDHLAQFANKLIVRVHIPQVQPLGVLQRGGIWRSQRVATELKCDLFIGLHARQVRHGNARRFEIDEMNRIRDRPHFVEQRSILQLSAGARHRHLVAPWWAPRAAGINDAVGQVDEPIIASVAHGFVDGFLFFGAIALMNVEDVGRIGG